MNILTPLPIGDAVFTSSYRNASYLFGFEAKEDGSFAVKQLWENKAQGYMSSPIAIGGTIYLHLGNQRLIALDAATGTERYSSQPFGKYWSLVHQGDRILALDTLYINTIALLVLLGIQRGTPLYFEAALVIAMLGFASTVVLSKYLLRGNIVE